MHSLSPSLLFLSLPPLSLLKHLAFGKFTKTQKRIWGTARAEILSRGPRGLLTGYVTITSVCSSIGPVFTKLV